MATSLRWRTHSARTKISPKTTARPSVMPGSPPPPLSEFLHHAQPLLHPSPLHTHPHARRKDPNSLSETGLGLQLTEEDWNPFQLFTLNLTISLKMILSHKLDQPILLMISHPEQAIQPILSTLLYYSCLAEQWPKSPQKLLPENLTHQARPVDGEPWILLGQSVTVIVKKSSLHYSLLAMEYLLATKNLLTLKNLLTMKKLLDIIHLLVMKHLLSAPSASSRLVCCSNLPPHLQEEYRHQGLTTLYVIRKPIKDVKVLLTQKGGVHRGVQQNVDYNFFTLSVNINNHFFRENQHQQRIVKINNQQFKISE